MKEYGQDFKHYKPDFFYGCSYSEGDAGCQNARLRKGISINAISTEKIG
jgi:hypothetical protein